MSDGAAGGPEGEEGGGREHDRFLPVANIRRVTGRAGSAELASSSRMSSTASPLCATTCTLPAVAHALRTCPLDGVL